MTSSLGQRYRAAGYVGAGVVLGLTVVDRCAPLYRALIA